MITPERIDGLLKEEKRGLDWEDRVINVLNEHYKKINAPDDTIYYVDDEIIEDYIAFKVKDSGIFTIKYMLEDIKDGSLYVKFNAYGNLESVDTDDLVELLEWAKDDLEELSDWKSED